LQVWLPIADVLIVYRTELSRCTQSEPRQGRVPFDSTLVNDFSF
jgi:hypothetical protein